MRHSKLIRFLVLGLCCCLMTPCALAGQADRLLLPAQLTTIKAEAFFGAASLDEVVLQEGVTAIGDRAFASSSARVIRLPESVAAIGKDAFADCPDLVAYVYADSFAHQWCVENALPHLLHT